jgi:hypothetical protein
MGAFEYGLFFIKQIMSGLPMNNLETLQKLTLGTDLTENVKINFENTDYEFEMRPLNDGELSKLQSIEKKPLVIKVGMQNGKRQTIQTNMNDVDINTGEFTEAQNEAMYNAISLSMNVPVEEIKKLPAGLPRVLFEQVIRISKLSDDDLTVIKSFRKD